MRLEKRLSPEEFVNWWAEQASQLSADDKDTLLNWIKHVMYKGRLSPKELKTLTESLKKGEKHIMKHGLAAWRDELIEETTITVAREEDMKIARILKEADVDVNTIANATGLTVDEIIQL